MWFRRPSENQREVLPPAFDLDVVVISDIGRKRAHNEDSGLNIRPGDADDQIEIAQLAPGLRRLRPSARREVHGAHDHHHADDGEDEPGA